jgi:lactoylglutathione lyase
METLPMKLRPAIFAALSTFLFLRGVMTPAVAGGAEHNPVRPVLTMTLDHVALHVADVATSVRFYTETLGLKEIPSQFPERRWIGIGKRGAIHIAGGRKTPVADDDDVHFAIAVDSLDPIMTRLKARGVIWVGSDDKPYGVSSSRRDGVHQIYFKDPDGYWVEINDALRSRR